MGISFKLIEFILRYIKCECCFEFEKKLAIVVDPTRTISSGKVNLGAFRTYPKVLHFILLLIVKLKTFSSIF